MPARGPSLRSFVVTVGFRRAECMASRALDVEVAADSSSGAEQPATRAIDANARHRVVGSIHGRLVGRIAVCKLDGRGAVGVQAGSSPSTRPNVASTLFLPVVQRAAGVLAADNFRGLYSCVDQSPFPAQLPEEVAQKDASGKRDVPGT